MMEIKDKLDITWHDLPKIESHFFAFRDVKDAILRGQVSDIHGLSNLLFEMSEVIQEAQLNKIERHLETGWLYLVKDDPRSPQFQLVEPKEGEKQGKVKEVRILEDVFYNEHLVKKLRYPTSFYINSQNSKSQISPALLNKDQVVVKEQPHSTPPKADPELPAKDPDDRTASLGPAAADTSSDKPIVCGICHAEKLEISCSHSSRNIGNAKVIQIVPTPDVTTSQKVSLLGVTVETKRKHGGADTVKGTLTLVDDKLDSCPSMQNELGEWKKTKNLEVKLQRKNDQPPSRWAKNDPPEVYYISGKGCTGGNLKRKIEVFPSHYYSVEGKLDIFRKYVEEINEAWEKWGKSIFDLSPVSLNPKLEGPAGFFEAGWGWKENDDWKSYFEVTASFGLNPILAIELEISISIVKLAMTSAGIPPTLQSLTTEHLADLMVFGSAGCKGTLLGSPHAKFFTDNSHKIDGEATFEVEGGVKLGLRGKVGSKYIVSAELILSGETKVKGSDKLELDSSGLYLQTNIDLEPLEAVAKVTIKYMVIFSKSKEKKWKPWDDIQLYKSEKQKLIPGS